MYETCRFWRKSLFSDLCFNALFCCLSRRLLSCAVGLVFFIKIRRALTFTVYKPFFKPNKMFTAKIHSSCFFRAAFCHTSSGKLSHVVLLRFFTHWYYSLSRMTSFRIFAREALSIALSDLFFYRTKVPKMKLIQRVDVPTLKLWVH